MVLEPNRIKMTAESWRRYWQRIRPQIFVVPEFHLFVIGSRVRCVIAAANGRIILGFKLSMRTGDSEVWLMIPCFRLTGWSKSTSSLFRRTLEGVYRYNL